MTKSINSASETREYLIQELKQLVGHDYEYYSQDKYDHSNEILDKAQGVFTQQVYYSLKEK